MTPAQDKPEPTVRMSWTGKDAAELVETIPITARAGERNVVVMSLGPGRDAVTSLPDLRAGDRLEVCAELEVTTDLTPRQAEQPGIRPTGTPYEYAPAIVAQLLLARGAGDVEPIKGEAVALGPPQRLKLSHDQHHGIFVFDGSRDGAAFDVPRSGLPWLGDSQVNLILSTSHADAKDGHVLLIGQNEPDGSVEGDMGAICAIRGRPGNQPKPRPATGAKLLVDKLPLQGDLKRVVYSLPLEDLKAGEQIRVRADLDTTSKELGYAARVKTRLFLADSPQQLEPEGNAHACEVGSSKGQVTKGNGSNCLPNAAVTRYPKVGVLRIVKDAKKPLYLNVVAVAGDPEKKGKPDSVKVLSSSRLAVIRYPLSALG